MKSAHNKQYCYSENYYSTDSKAMKNFSDAVVNIAKSLAQALEPVMNAVIRTSNAINDYFTEHLEVLDQLKSIRAEQNREKYEPFLKYTPSSLEEHFEQIWLPDCEYGYKFETSFGEICTYTSDSRGMYNVKMPLNAGCLYVFRRIM